MLHFLRRLVLGSARATEAPARGYIWPWLIAAFAAVAVPWALFPAVETGRWSQALSAENLWAALWPVLAGLALAFALWGWEYRLPQVPAGDVVVAGETALRATAAWGKAIDRADHYLREWPVASLSLLTLVIILGVAMLAWG